MTKDLHLKYITNCTYQYKVRKPKKKNDQET